MGVNRAVEEYNVSRIALKDRFVRRVRHGSKSGPDPYLMSSKEGKLVSFLINACKMGHGKTKREVIDVVRRTVKKQKEKEGKDFEKCKFNGEGWWHKFVQRHPKLSLRTADALSFCWSNAVHQESLGYYFGLLNTTPEGNNVMDRACYIYNMDHTGMPWTTNNQSVLLIRV